MNCQSDEKRMREVEQVMVCNAKDLKRILSAIFIMMKVITAENFGSERTKKITEKEFNVNPYEDLLLAGVVAKHELDSFI